ncbi:site-specific integrase [Oceanicola sp. D3]|uniref:site-specific integrase n=1 Tax=Oceanicola sp. D3 TaxID=2587163 RepID=UPI00143D309A|nr:site-specific integrase [Oceanicola sp. D3]
MLARHLAVCGVEAEQLVKKSVMDHGKLRSKVRDYFRAQLEDGKRRIDAGGPLTDTEKQGVSQSVSMLEDGNREFWHLMGSDNARAELDAFFAATDLPVEQYRDHIPRVLDEIRKARIGAYKALLQYAEGLETYDFTEPMSAAVSAPDAPEDATGYPGINEAVETFFRVHEKSANWTHGTVEKRRAMLAIAVEWFGPERSMAKISKRDAAELKEALLSLPANRSKVSRLRGLSLRDAVRVEGLPRISNATVNAHLSAFKIFWDWAEKHDYAPEALFQSMTVSAKGHGSKERKPFAQDALAKAYAALTDRQGAFYKKTSHRWATLIAMFSGARLNEVCQLQVDDIKEVQGIWVFDFNDEGDAHKRLKSSAAKRRVPIHSKLIELGLLDYHQQQQATGQEKMFPDYSYHPKHGYGGSLSKWFNRTFTQTLGIKTEAHVFHGLRHTFATRLGHADVPTERIQFIIGHEREGVTHQVYMKDGYTIEQTRDAVELFRVGKD